VKCKTYCAVIARSGNAGKNCWPRSCTGRGELIGSLVLPFADLDPADHQATWNEPVPPYGQTADQLIMNREVGKKLWGFLLRRRGANPTAIILQDDGGRDRRALSIAHALARRLQGAPTIHQRRDNEWVPVKDDVPPNKYIFDMTKATREMVSSW
jgi:hypothetical protein